MHDFALCPKVFKSPNFSVSIETKTNKGNVELLLLNVKHRSKKKEHNIIKLWMPEQHNKNIGIFGLLTSIQLAEVV